MSSWTSLDGGGDGEAATGRPHRDSSRSSFWDGAVLRKSRTTRDLPRTEGGGANKVLSASQEVRIESVCAFCAAAIRHSLVFVCLETR